MPQFRLHYHVSNNGDGSASAHFHPTKEAAEKADSEEEECWGEPCASHIVLKEEGGELFYRTTEWDGKKYHEKWIKVEKIA